MLVCSFTQSFTREFGVWKSVSGPKLWKLHGFSILIDLDNEDVRFLLVSPLAEGDLTTLSRVILRNNLKDQIFTFVSAFTLCHIHCPSNLIVSDSGHCPWFEDFAWLRHNSWWPSSSTSLVVIYPSHSFYFRVTSYAMKGIVIWPISAFPNCPRCPRLPPLHHWSTLVGRHQNWFSRCGVSRVIFSRLHAQYTRFLSISLIFRHYSRIFAHKMFTQKPPYEKDSSAKDRSKPPRRIGLLKHEDWNKLWEILVDCWSADPLDRPTASDLESKLSEIAGRSILPSSFLLAEAKWFSTLTCFALSTHIDDNGRDFETLAHDVKNLIEKWQNTSVSYNDALALLEVTNIRFSLRL